MEKAMLEFINVKKHYKLSDEVIVKAVDGINIKIKEGEFVALYGPSGSGKSTIMHMLGLLDRPTSGDIIINGINSKKLSEKKLAKLRGKTIGFIFQSFFLTPNLTAMENVELPMMLLNIEENYRLKRAKDLMSMVGLEKRLNHLPRQLSGGQKQRVAIARALANFPKIILADEPTGNLDSKTGKEVIQIFKKLWKDGNTLIIVTHDPKIAMQAPRIIKILDGKVISDGKYKITESNEFIG
ncbi:MAG: ABC transporter ATP-binding protein [Candidatus Nanoarchaeia archaeon]|jgi:putative ABC transport system ATP-binding protein